MGVYIDNANIPYRGMKMCHMIADSTDELVAMATAIGVNPKWIQKAGTRMEHFDVCQSKRALAIKHGAIEVTTRDLARKMFPHTDVPETPAPAVAQGEG